MYIFKEDQLQYCHLQFFFLILEIKVSAGLLYKEVLHKALYKLPNQCPQFKNSNSKK